MSLFVIADLHLLSDGAKSMEVFGARWKDYIAKIEKNWRAVVNPEDTVVIPGDISWAMKLEETLEDFRFLDSLPGTKLIGKGNHDFWWSTAAKMNAFFEKHKITTLKIFYNNAYLAEDCILCGSRGWFLEEAQQKTVGDADYEMIVNREAIRLRLSLEEAVKLQKSTPTETPLPILVFLHFPPVWGDYVCRPILDLLHEYDIKTCYFGHIHGAYHTPRTTTFEGIDFVLAAADYLKFAPIPIYAD